MARIGFGCTLLFLATVGLLGSGCYTWRSASADGTIWNELPNDPRPELWAEGTPKLSVVFDGAYRALGDAEPSFDPKSTQYYLGALRKAGAFAEVLERGSEEEGRLPRVRMTRIFVETDNLPVNLVKAVTVPGLLGYRYDLVGTLTLEIQPPNGEPIRYEARSSLTCVYHTAGNHDNARRFAFREADRVNTEAVLHQLRADPRLFELLPPAATPDAVSATTGPEPVGAAP